MLTIKVDHQPPNTDHDTYTTHVEGVESVGSRAAPVVSIMASHTR